MLAHDSQLLALLPVVGLCSCVVASEAPTTTAPAAANGLIEAEPEREPLTIAEAMIRSGRESLAAGHFEAAYATLSAASLQYPEHAEALTLDVIDAALGARKLEIARGMIAKLPQLEFHKDAQKLQKRRLDLRELEAGVGLGACEAQVDPDARSLRRVDGVLAAWNELRSGLPADHAIPIPSSLEQASDIVCPLGCAVGEPNFAWLEGDNERTVALVIAAEDGSLSVMPDLLHVVDSSCDDEPLLGFEQHGQLVRVRAYVDQLDAVSPDDWRLVELPQYGSPPVSAASSPSYAYAYASSGYQAPPNSYYASSGYNPGYAYGYGYGYGYGCGHGGYDPSYYSSCEAVAHVERDLVIDLQRGEVVLDIVRTGNHGSALGRVTMASAPAGAIVDVDACGTSRSLQLSYT